MKRKIIFIIGLGLIFGLGINYLFAAEEEEAILKPVEYKAQSLRDPFQDYIEEAETVTPAPVEPVPVQLPAVTIQGIVWGGTTPQAIINNKVVKVGDTIEGMRVISIDKSGITVSYGNREFNLASPAATNAPSLPKRRLK
jgi:hypothetical protein